MMCATLASLLIALVPGLSSSAQPARPATLPTTAPATARLPPTLSPAGTVVYVLDTTGSVMGGLLTSRRLCATAIAGLRDGQRFGVVTFTDERVRSFGPTTKSEAALRDAVEFNTAEDPHGSGVNTVGPAIAAAAKMRPAVIVLITDTLTGGPDKQEQDNLRAAVRATGMRLNVAVIGDEDSPFLRHLAAQTHGEYWKTSARE